MKDDFDTVYDMIEHAIEYAFEGKMQLKFYAYLKYRKTTKAEVDSFIQSSTAAELSDVVLELELVDSEYSLKVNEYLINEAVKTEQYEYAQKLKNTIDLLIEK